MRLFSIIVIILLCFGSAYIMSNIDVVAVTGYYLLSPDNCSDGILNQDETDVDCGGVCPGCSVGENCLTNSDCSSNNCVNNICESSKGGRGGGSSPTCPTCPEDSEWSECVDVYRTRTTYYCNPTTNYICVATEETEMCEYETEEIPEVQVNNKISMLSQIVEWEKTIKRLRSEGKDVSELGSLFEEARKAYENNNYEEFYTLANEINTKMDDIDSEINISTLFTSNILAVVFVFVSLVTLISLCRKYTKII